MDTPAAAWLIDAIVVLGLALVLWALLAFPLLFLKRALADTGALDFPSKVSALAERLGAGGAVWGAFMAHADASMLRNGDQHAVRVVLDERHADLKDSLGRTELSVREAVNSVQGLAGYSGGTTFLNDFNALRERTKLVDRLGVELSPEIEDEYINRAKIGGSILGLVFMAAAVALVNGLILSVLFLELTPFTLFGVLPMAYPLGILAVLVELMVGRALFHFRRNAPMMILIIIFVILATLFECFAISIFSVEFATALRNVEPEDANLYDYWMVLLALVFTPMTSITGYMLEETLNQRHELKGKMQFASELKDCNKFVDELPSRWAAIEQKARSAEAAIERFQDALGGQDDRLSGAIDTLAKERKALSTALLGARIEDWPNLVRGAEADARNAAVQNILFCLGVALFGTIYAIAVSYVLARATADNWSGLLAQTGGFLTAAVFLIVGNLAFNRLRLIQGQDGRALPLNASPYHKALAALLLVVCAVGLIWTSAMAFGDLGYVFGLFLAGLGGGLCFLGFNLERAARGLVLIVAIVSNGAMAAFQSFALALRYGLLWILAGVAWVLAVVVRFAARPAEWLQERLDARRLKAPAAPPALDAAT